MTVDGQAVLTSGSLIPASQLQLPGVWRLYYQRQPVLATVTGGYLNEHNGQYSVVGGGEYNRAPIANFATVSGGVNNGAATNLRRSAAAPTVCGGYAATLGGGEYNTNNGSFSTVSGGVK